MSGRPGVSSRIETLLNDGFQTLFACFSFCLLAVPLAAQETVQQETEEVVSLEPIIVTATRSERALFDIPNTVNVLSEDDLLHRRIVRTVPESLKEVPGVMVQKTSHGQGSPFIRGFTGFRTLFLIDGIRLNNSVFRDGPNQYSNTLDPLTVSRLEVIKGPSSVLYGSDAVGGTVNAISRSRKEYGESFQWGRRVYYRYGDAESSHTARAEISGNLEQRLGFLGGTSYRDFGTLQGGGDTGAQFNTDYDELDGDFRLDFFPSENKSLTFAWQRVFQNNVPRTHKTISAKSFRGTTIGSELRRDLDQERQLAYLKYELSDLGGPVESITTSLSWQAQNEERFRIRGNGRQDRQSFDVDTFGFTVQAKSNSRLGHWTYGAEYYRDFVDSQRRDFNADGSLRKIRIQGPVGDDASYDLLGFYIQDEIPLWDERLDLILGGRFNYARANADKVEDPQSGNQTSITEDWSKAVGSARALYRLDEADHWHVFAGISQGFRAPNLSDLTRLDTARTNELETPSPGLDPENFIAYEAGLKVQFETVNMQAAYFYTDISDLIVRTPTGNVIGGDNEVTKKNAGDGFVQGVELAGAWRLHPQLTVAASFFWMEGYVDTFPTSAPVTAREPLDRLQPMMGHLSLRWEHPERKGWAEIITTLAAKQDKLSTRDKADTQRIPPGGTPGYAVFSLRAGWRLTDKAILSAALENLADKDYRIHGSGQNESGRNLVISLDWHF